MSLPKILITIAHYRYAKMLKNYRVSAAHPTIIKAMVELALENSKLPENDTKPFNELFTMYKILKPEE